MRPKTAVSVGHVLELRPVLGQVGPGDGRGRRPGRPVARATAWTVADAVARDDLDRDALAGEVGDGVLGVGAHRLGQHDEARAAASPAGRRLARRGAPARRPGARPGGRSPACSAIRAPSASATGTPARASMSGAPSTRRAAALEGGAAPLARRGERHLGAAPRPRPGPASAIARIVALRRADARRQRRRGPRAARPRPRPSAGSTPTTRSRLSVSVPVLSRQRVSTEARLSIALSRWASVPRRASRTAATAKVRLVSSTSPSGTSGTSAATSVRGGVVEVASGGWPATVTRIAASGTIPATVSLRIRLMSCWSGLRRRRVPRASAARRSAKLVGPPPRPRYSPEPATQ